MPIGYNCEFATFGECVAAQRRKGHSLEEAQRICGAIQRDTEGKCKRRDLRAAGELPDAASGGLQKDDGGGQLNFPK